MLALRVNLALGQRNDAIARIEDSKIDSFRVDEFLVTKQYFQDTGDTIWGGQFKIYRNDTLLVSSRIWPFYAIENEPYGPPPKSFPDLNRDGVKDVTFRYGCGGTAAYETTVIYNLESTAVEIGFFDGLERSFGASWPADIDSDSIPEIMAYDLYFRNNYFYPAGPLVYLVWKWDNSTRYFKLANYKLGSRILKEKHQIDLNSFNLDEFVGENSQIEYTTLVDGEKHPLKLFSEMVMFAYNGYIELADSVFNSSWPDSMPGKNEFYIDAWQKIKSAPLWKELQDSDW